MLKIKNPPVTSATKEHADDLTELRKILAEVEDFIPPLWSLSDYVAVNPWVGFTSKRFLETQQTLKQFRDCEMLMPRDYYDSLVKSGRLTAADIESAVAQSSSEYPEFYERFDASKVINGTDANGVSHSKSVEPYRTVASTIDEQEGSNWSSNLINDISRHLGAHYDQGQAFWPSPWKEQPLYTAWQEASRVSRRMDLLGLKGFRAYVDGLSPEPAEAILGMLKELEIPRQCWRSFLACEIFSIAGWASYVKKHARDAQSADRHNDDLTGLIALRLAYDVALALNHWNSYSFLSLEARLPEGSFSLPAPSRETLSRYVLQVASETSFRRQLLKQLSQKRDANVSTSRKSVQFVFCIDVRSEVIRRHLEAVDDSIETFGFAGFFGMALEYVRLGTTKGSDQCPVLLKPSFRIRETVLDPDESRRSRVMKSLQESQKWNECWRLLQTSAASCFTFVESLGLTYAAKLLKNAMSLTSRSSVDVQDDPVVGPEIASCENAGLPVEKQIDLAHGMLINLGLTDGFARLVVLCGHAAHVTNNPYKASLDCGACGGHSGEPNARVAARLLNEPAVRQGLMQRGVAIPSDTWFVAAVHDTVSDRIRFCDVAHIPASHHADYATVAKWTEIAGERTCEERSQRFRAGDQADLGRRGLDWSQVRPEWGLAGNAAFLVARRQRTSGLNLRGRTFLHSYDHTQDEGLKILTLIMTAPMIVTNWINLQYYASTVDQRAYGSGNKTLHNVVGQFGVLEGNAGDLKTGLPLQSVFDGRQFQHEPLRLLVVIEAPRAAIETVIGQHSMVRDLATNGWLSIVAMDRDQFFRWTSEGTWAHEHVVTSEHRSTSQARHKSDDRFVSSES